MPTGEKFIPPQEVNTTSGSKSGHYYNFNVNVSLVVLPWVDEAPDAVEQHWSPYNYQPELDGGNGHNPTMILSIYRCYHICYWGRPVISWSNRLQMPVVQGKTKIHASK